jgi:hypothetical protein
MQRAKEGLCLPEAVWYLRNVVKWKNILWPQPSYFLFKDCGRLSAKMFENNPTLVYVTPFLTR